MGLAIIEGIYAKSNGNGPLHLLHDGAAGVATVCGVSNWRQLSAPSAWPGWSVNEVCKRCRKRATPRAEVDASALAEAVVDLKAARERVSGLLMATQSTRSRGIDGYLALAHECGYTLQELGDLIGLTRERVRQRIAAHAPETSPRARRRGRPRNGVTQ